MKFRGALVGGMAVLLMAGCSVDDRFGDPDVLEQIQSLTNCDELQQWADIYLRTITGEWGDAPPGAHASMTDDQAVGYANAASDRMDEIGC